MKFKKDGEKKETKKNRNKERKKERKKEKKILEKKDLVNQGKQWCTDNEQFKSASELRTVKQKKPAFN